MADIQRGWGMTLLGAVVADGYVLMAGDTSGLYADPVQPAPGYTNASMVPAQKCHPVRDRPLVWGLCGNAEKTTMFQKWIDNDRSESWDELVEGAGETVRNANEALRKHAQRSKQKGPLPEMYVLIAGYVGGVPDIGSARQNSQGCISQTGVKVPLAFAGAFEETARVAWHAALDLDPGRDLTTPGNFRAFMDSLARHLPALGWPVDLWEITPGGCREVARP